MRRSARTSLFAVLPLALAGFLLAADDGAPLWDADDALFVTEARFGDGEDADGSITFSWDAPVGGTVGEFELLRDGEKIGVTADGSQTTITDPSPATDGEPHAYTLVATYDGGETTEPLGSPAVRLKDDRAGCTILWTAAQDRTWEDARNWAPYGGTGAALGASRIPGAEDVACINHYFSANPFDPVSYIDISAPQPIDSLLVTASPGPVGIGDALGLDLLGGDLKIADRFEVHSLRLSGGTLTLAGDGTIGDDTGFEGGELRLAGGTVDVGGTLQIVADGELQVDGGTSTRLTGGGTIVGSELTFRNNGANGAVSGDDITVQVDRVSFEAAGGVLAAAGDAALVTDRILVGSGDGGDVGWTVAELTPAEDLYLSAGNGGMLVVDDLADVDAVNGDTATGAELNVFGTIDLREDITIFDGGRVVVGGTGQVLTSKLAAPWEAVTAIRDLTVRNDAAITLDGDLTVDELRLSGGVLTLGRTVTEGFGAGTSLRLERGSILTVGETLVLGKDWTFSMIEDSKVVGPIENLGDLGLGLVPIDELDVTTEGGQLELTDPLDLDPDDSGDGIFRVVLVGSFVDGVFERYEVSDLKGDVDVALGGTLIVRVEITAVDADFNEEDLPEAVDQLLLSFDEINESGAFKEILVQDIVYDEDTGEPFDAGRFDVEVRDGDGVYLVTGDGGGPDVPAWAPGDALVLDEARDGGDPEVPDTVVLRWPTPSDSGLVTGYRIHRNGEELATVGAGDRAFPDEEVPPGVNGWTVEALYDGGVAGPLGSPALRFVGSDDGCTIAWTGAVDGSWDEARNWAPYGGKSGDLGLPRTPGETDTACVTHDQQAYGTVTTTDAPSSVAGIVVDLGTEDGRAALPLTVAGGELTTGTVRAEGLVLVDGQFQVLETGTVAVPAVDEDDPAEIIFAGGGLVVRDTLDTPDDGRVELVGTNDTRSSLAGGVLTTGSVLVVPGAESTLVGSNDARLVADELVSGDLNTAARGGFSLAPASSATLDVDAVAVRGGATGSLGIGWTLGTATPDTVLDLEVLSGSLRVLDLDDVGTGDAEAVFDAVVAGSMAFGEDVATIDGAVRMTGPDAVLRVGGVATTPFDGLEAVRDLVVSGGANVVVPGNLAVDTLLLGPDAYLLVDGDLQEGFGPGTDLQLLDGGDLVVNGRSWSLPTDGVVTVTGGVDVTGSLTVDGTLAVGERGDGTTHGQVDVDGNLTLGATGSLRLLVDGDEPEEHSFLRVLDGELAAGGELLVDTTLPPDPALDFSLQLADAPVSGSFADVRLTGANAGDYEIVVGGTAILLNARDKSNDTECDQSIPLFRGLTVRGCWAQAAPGIYRTTVGIAAQLQGETSVGGLVLRPVAQATGEVEIFLDVNEARIWSRATGQAEGVGEVEVLIPIVGDAPGRAIGDEFLGGVVDGIDWDLTQGAEDALVGIADFLGLSLDSLPSLTIDQDTARWVIDATAQLPVVFEQLGIDFEIPFGDQGIQVGALAVGGLAVVVGEVAEAAGVDLSYLGDRAWQVANDVQDGLGIDGSFAYTGNLDSGSVELTNLEIAGLGPIDVTLTVSTVTGGAKKWSGTYSDELIVEFITSGSSLQAGRIQLTGIDLGVARINRLEIARQVTRRWDMTAQVTSLGTPSLGTGTVSFDDDGGVAFASLTLEGDFGPLGHFDPLTFSYTGAVGPDDFDGAFLGLASYSVSGSVGSGGNARSISGLAVVSDNGIRFLEIDLDLALGELATIEARITLDAATRTFTLSEQGTDGGSAILRCDGTTSEIGGFLTLAANGVPTAGGLEAEGVCLGVEQLESLTLTLDQGEEEDPGSVFTFAAVIVSPEGDEQVIDGFTRFDEGDLVEGELNHPELSIGGLFSLPAGTLTVATDDRGTVLSEVTAPRRADGPVAVDAEIVLGDGNLVAADVLVGSLEEPEDGAPSSASFGELLDFTGVQLVYDRDQQLFAFDSRLRENDAGLAGTVGLRADGTIDQGRLDVEELSIGSLAALDLSLTFDQGTSFTLDGSIAGGESDGAAITGDLTLDGGTIETATITLAEIRVGELGTIDDFAFVYDADGLWALGGTWDGGGEPVTIAGGLSFDDGVLVEAELELQNLSLGSTVVEDFTLDLVRAEDDDNRVGTYDLSALVRSPLTDDGTADLEPVTGSLRLVDGEVTNFSLTVPHLEFGGLLSLDDLDLIYAKDGDVATVSGTGTLQTAADTGAGDVSFRSVVDDGQVLSVEITAQTLELGGPIRIDQFRASYDRAVPLDDCPGLDGDDKAQLYTLSGQVGDTSAGGCLGLDDDTQVVAFQLELGDLALGEVGTIEEAAVVYASSREVEVVVDDQPRMLSQTTLDVSGIWSSAATDPTEVTGDVVLFDGGLASFDLAISQITLSETVRFENLVLSYENTNRFQAANGETAVLVLGDAVHGGGTTTLGGALIFGGGAAPSQQLTGASLAVADLDLGPATIDELIFEYKNDEDATSWQLSGEITAGGAPTSIEGSAVVEDGRLQDATLVLGGITIGELFTIDNLALSFQREGDRERFAGSGTVTTDSGTSSASASFTFGRNGRLEDASVDVANVSWGGLFTLQDLELNFIRNGAIVRWDLSAILLQEAGTSTFLTGQLILEDSVVISGTMSMSDVKIGSLFDIETLDLTASRTAGQTTFAAALRLRTDTGTVGASGSMRWADGTLEEASLGLASAPVGDLFTLRSVTIDYDRASRWAFRGSVEHEDGTSTLGGELTFTDGRATAGALTAQDVQLGPLNLVDFALAIQSQVDDGETVSPIGTVCGVSDQTTGGTRYAVTATIGTGDGGSSQLGGRFRVDDRRLQEAVICGADLQITDFVVLDRFDLRYDTGRPADPTTGFSGSVTVKNVDRGTTSNGSFDFRLLDGVLQTVNVTANNLKLGELLDLRNLDLDYDRNDDGAGGLWAVSADLARPGQGSGAFAGAIDVEDGVIVAGALSVNSLPFGDAFVLQSLDIEYRGRRAAANPPTSTSTGTFTTTDDGCSASPSSLGQLTTDNGAESAFAVSANVLADGQTYAAGGSLSFANGRLQSFDVTVACLPIGSFTTVSDVRVQWTRDQVFRFTGRVVRDDGDGDVSGSASGEFVFTNGRLSGGDITIQGVPLGAVRIEEFTLSLGQNPNGTSTWGIGISVRNSNNNTVSGSGSVTMRDGRIVGGSFTLPEIPIIDVLVVRNVSLTFDSTQEGFTRLAGSGGIKKVAGGEANFAFDVTWKRGDGLWAAAFTADQASLFEVVPVGNLSIAFDRGDDTWSGDISIGFGAGGDRRSADIVERNGGISARNQAVASVGGQPSSLQNITFGPPGFRVGFEITDGRLTSGIFGFDANGDGNVDQPDADGNLPAAGAGNLAQLPLKAFYIRYCSESAANNPFVSFCDPIDADTWAGRVAIEFPTDAAPMLDASLVLRNGRFAEARLDVGFGTPGIPLFPGVFLRTLGASIEVDPRLAFEGRLGVNLLEIADVEAAFGFSEEPDPASTGLPADEYEAEYLRFYLQASVTLFDLPIRANAFVEVQTRGYLAMGGGVDIVLIERAFSTNNFLVVSGGVEGSVFDGEALGAVNPRTGRAITGASFQVRGFVNGSIAGINVASAEFVVNPIGALGCIGTIFGDTGAGLRWSGGFTLGCDTEDYVIEGVDSEFGNFARSSVGGAPVARNLADETLFLDVAEGEEFVGVVVNGQDGEQPRVALVGPDGTRLDAQDDAVLEDDGVLISSVPGAKLFQVFQPAAGRWTIEVLEDSAVVDDVQVFQNLEPAQVNGTVSEIDGGRYALDWTMSLDGTKRRVELHERVDGVTSASLGELVGTSGRIEFGTSGPLEAGTRELVAVVTNDGMPGDEIVVATYEVPEATFADAPRNVTVEEIPGGARVTWDPPADNGGRRITSYKIFSNAGFSTVVEPDVGEIEIDIPSMTVGEEVPVAVEAFTILGWGQRGVGVFTATQETAQQFITPGTSGTRVLLDGVASGVVTRLSGDDRVATAAAISRQHFAPGVDTVWLATAGNFPDALAAGPAAVQRGGPILLVTDELPAVTRAEIERLQPRRVVVLGGPAAVANDVVAEVAAVNDQVTRFGGADRFETAAITSAATFEPGVDVVYVATGRNFPDALAGGVAAGRDGAPVLLTEQDGLPDVTRDELVRLQPGAIVVLGGQVAVGDPALADIAVALPGVGIRRLGGEDRYDTAAMIAASSFDDADEVWLATGRNFPDALAGVPAAVRVGAPLLLVDDGVPGPTRSELNRLGASRATILGGPVAVPATVESALLPLLSAVR